MKYKQYKISIITGKYRGQVTNAKRLNKTHYYITDISQYNSKKNKYYYKLHRSNFKIL